MAKESKMKWHKFKTKLEQFPWLVNTIGFGHLVGHPNLDVGEVNDIIRTFVRQKLKFVAPRRFEHLELGVERDDGRNTLSWAVRCEPHLGGSRDVWYEEVWYVLWHMEGQQPEHGDLVSWISIQTKLDQIKGWYERQCIQGDTRTLYLDCVASVATSGRIPREGLSEMSVEIFPFPAEFTLRPSAVKAAA